MSKAFERELLEVAQWYTFHKDGEMGVEKRLEFLTKTCDFLIWTLGRAAEDLQRLEGRLRNGHEFNHDPYIMNSIPKNLRTATGGGSLGH